MHEEKGKEGMGEGGGEQVPKGIRFNLVTKNIESS